MDLSKNNTTIYPDENGHYGGFPQDLGAPFYIVGKGDSQRGAPTIGLSIAQEQELELERQRSRMRTETECFKIKYRNYCRNEQEMLSAELAERMMHKKEEIRERRELLTDGVFENSEGYLCRELISAEGKTIGTKPIIQQRFMEVFFLYAASGSDGVYVIKWHDSERRVFLTGKDVSPEGMEKAFIKAGISYQTSRDYRKNLNALVFAFVMKHSKSLEVPRCYGWNLMSTGEWVFAVRGKDLTLKEVKEHANGKS